MLFTRDMLGLLLALPFTTLAELIDEILPPADNGFDLELFITVSNIDSSLQKRKKVGLS